jgi:hypothetical protein
MPRNPNKKQCTKPKCHNYAMRGRLMCRSHLDHELGPRGAGAPMGNLNALTDGFATLPLTPATASHLAQDIVRDPDNYLYLIADVLRDSRRLTINPLRSLAFLKSLIDQLQPVIAHHTFTREAETFINQFPDYLQPEVKAIIWEGMLHLPPLQRLKQFRVIRANHRHRNRGNSLPNELQQAIK